MSPETTDFVSLKGIPAEIKNVIKNISKNSGVSITQLLKPVLRKVVDSYSEEMKKPGKKKKEPKQEILIRGVGMKLKTELGNIAENADISVTNILIPKLQEFIKDTPERLKRTPEEY